LLDRVARGVECVARDVGAIEPRDPLVWAQAQRWQLAFERLGKRRLARAWKPADEVQCRDDPPRCPRSLPAAAERLS
jgi:hypothetical protein